MTARVRRWVLRVIALLFFILLAGATYQGISTALERREFPHPGRLIDVGGHQLHLYCTGSGKPTVVLEATAAGMSAAWGWVQPALSQTTRVCSYDRSGLGWSEAGAATFDPRRPADDLRTLLERGGEQAPFIIAGHGLGAAFGRAFAARYPERTSALVVIDEPALGPPEDTLTRLAPVAPWLARTGVLRVNGAFTRYANGLPDDWSGGAMRAFLNRPNHLTRTALEVERWADAMRLAREAPVSVKVIEVRANGTDRVRLLADRATAERVVDALRQAVAAVTSPSPAP